MRTIRPAAVIHYNQKYYWGKSRESLPIKMSGKRAENVKNSLQFINAIGYEFKF